jgi:xylan 1,4-beta-xylosidase
MLRGLPHRGYRLQHWRIDHTHSNIAAGWRDLGDSDWPDPNQWSLLRARNTLDAYDPERDLPVHNGRTAVEFPLPMPAVSYLELSPTT